MNGASRWLDAHAAAPAPARVIAMTDATILCTFGLIWSPFRFLFRFRLRSQTSKQLGNRPGFTIESGRAGGDGQHGLSVLHQPASRDERVEADARRGQTGVRRLGRVELADRQPQTPA